jgi:SAM-dependent methyltransferase
MNNIFINFEKEIEFLEDYLNKRKIESYPNYKDWKKSYIGLYGKENTNLRLYILYAIIFLSSISFTLNYILKKEEKLKFISFSTKKLIDLNDFMVEKYDFNFKKEISYFIPFVDLLDKIESDYFKYLLQLIESEIIKYDCPPEYKLDMIFQGIINPQIRHKSGEFYTPPFLVKNMVKEVYNFGDKVLDPCCGSGNFLIEIIKRIINGNENHNSQLEAIRNIYGFDLNPISLYLTKLNIIFLSATDFTILKNNFKIHDFLLGIDTSLPKDFDLVIGNPPWYTLREIESIKLQTELKVLSDRLEIKPFPKNILNIEIASLFFYQAKSKFMKEGGIIFFIITEGVLSGSHAARFRTFKGFKNLKIWMFSKSIKKSFNIDFICIFAQKASNDIILDNLEIPVYQFSINNNNIHNFTYSDSIDLIESGIKTYIPYSIEKKGTKTFVKKIIEKEKLQKLLPLNESYYKKLFHKGADLNPRSLIFMKCENAGNDLYQIKPDKRIYKRAKEPWNKTFFKNELIEKDYIFKVIKSTELVKFFVYDYYEVFLPLEKVTLEYKYDRLKEMAKIFYDKVNNIYLKHKKDTTNHTSLMDNLNRWSKLINQRQLSYIKVVYNNSGSILNSAVIQGNFLVTGDLSFFATKDIDEAYYLCSILNSDMITNQVKIKKSSRHIFKLPFELPIKKFDKENDFHKKLAELGKKAEKVSEETVKTLLYKNSRGSSKISIQHALKPRLKSIIDQINVIAISLLNA